MKNLKNKKVWEKPEVKLLSVKKETMGGAGGRTEQNTGQTQKKLAS